METGARLRYLNSRLAGLVQLYCAISMAALILSHRERVEKIVGGAVDVGARACATVAGLALCGNQSGRRRRGGFVSLVCAIRTMNVVAAASIRPSPPR